MWARGLVLTVFAVCMAANAGWATAHVRAHETGGEDAAWLTPDSLPGEVAQWAATYAHCYLGSDDPRVLGVSLLRSNPRSPTPDRPLAVVLLSGGFQMDGFLPGASGRHPYLVLVIDLPFGWATGGGWGEDLDMLLRSAESGGWTVSPSTEWLRVRPGACASPHGSEDTTHPLVLQPLS